MKLSTRRFWLFGTIAIGVIILMTLLAAPANNKLNSGSTYNRAPEGYGAWYAFMSARGTPVRRWRKPVEDLVANADGTWSTLLQVNSSLTEKGLSEKEQNWVKNGNILVVLGVRSPVTTAAFSTIHKSEVGSIKIDTRRRNNYTKERILGDKFGAIVWEKNIGKGRVIFAATPHLAANAYQDFQANYEFLAKLVTQAEARREFSNQNSVWVDEYIHGYKDSGIIKGKNPQNLFNYLAQTPIFPALIQVVIVLLVAIWMGNRRFGKHFTLSAPVFNNSQAYIQALAGVLQKAESSEFILEIVGKEEQLQLQKALFLGQTPLDYQVIVDAWVQQTGRPASELEQLLQAPSKKHRLSETKLLSWLKKWEQIRRYFIS